MSDRDDARLKTFAAELVADPPEPPQFPHPDVVFVGTHTRRGEHVTDTKTNTPSQKPTRSRGPIIALAAFVAVVVIGGGALLINAALDEGTEPATDSVAESSTSTTVAVFTDASEITGTTGEVVGGRAGSLPTAVEFHDDGTYGVKDNLGMPLDKGTYTAQGETVTFESDASDDVLWVSNDVHLRIKANCEGMVGEYQAAFDAEGQMTLTVVWDECPTRVTAANGIVMRMVP